MTTKGTTKNKPMCWYWGHFFFLSFWTLLRQNYRSTWRRTHHRKCAKLWSCASFAFTARGSGQAGTKVSARKAFDHCRTSNLRQDVIIITDAELYFTTDALALGPSCSFETHEHHKKSPDLQGPDFSWSFGSHKLLHLDPGFVHVRNAIKALVVGFDMANHSSPRCLRRAVIHRSHPRTRVYVWSHTSSVTSRVLLKHPAATDRLAP